MWELVPKNDRPEAQVVLTLPNGEQETIDGFLYQEFRWEASRQSAVGSRPQRRGDRGDGETGRPDQTVPSPRLPVASVAPSPRRDCLLPTAYCLLASGPPHTRYRYMPRMAGTHLWVHRTPAGGFLEQGAFEAEAEEARGEGALKIENCKLKIASWVTDQTPFNLQFSIYNLQFSMPSGSSPLQSLQKLEEELDRASAEGQSLRIELPTPSEPAPGTDELPDLAPGWVLDRVLEAAAARGVGVIFRLPSPPDPGPAALYGTLYDTVCRYAPMPALAAWELDAAGEIAEAAAGFLRAHDPRHPVIRAR